MDELEQHAIGIAVHDAGHRRMRIVTDRVGVLAGRCHQFLRARNELSRDGIGGIVRLDQRGDLRRHGDGITRGDPLQLGQRGRRHKPARHQLGRLAQRRRKFGVDPVHASPAGGVHTTWSILGAPLASITSRSKPSATPLASGIWATAARKSSSSG